MRALSAVRVSAAAVVLSVVTVSCAQDDPSSAPRAGAVEDRVARAVPDLPPLRRAAAPWEVVAQIEAAETAIRDPGTSADGMVAAGRLQQLAYRRLADRPGWDERVAELAAPRWAGVVGANVGARREMLAMQRAYEPHDALPAWRIVTPEPAADLRAYYQEAERRHGVEWEYLAAINLIETGMGRIRGDSVAGAQGPMQFIPATWEQYGEGDVTDPRDAILGAGNYLAARGFASGDRAAIDDALYAYNNHPAYVRAIRAHAEVMQRNPRAFLGYYHWDVVFLTERGDVTLPVGYDADEPIPVDRWLADHPQP